MGRLTLLLAAVGLAGCGGHARLYADHGVVATHGAVTVHDVSFSSGGRSIAGYLVLPAAKGPGVVLVHGSGGDRRELLAQAVALARGGAFALAITAPSSAYPPAAPSSVEQLLAQSRDVSLRDVAAVRRAGDVLESAGATRLGYLGWSAGAKTGALVAARDARFAALALLSAGADKLSQFVAAAPPPARPLVVRDLRPVDPIGAVAHARPGTLLLEDGRRDRIVPRAALENIVRAAPRGTVVRWYDAGHALDARAYRDAVEWLLRRLG